MTITLTAREAAQIVQSRAERLTNSCGGFACLKDAEETIAEIKETLDFYLERVKEEEERNKARQAAEVARELAAMRATSPMTASAVERLVQSARVYQQAAAAALKAAQ